jgi:hypothetical protein
MCLGTKETIASSARLRNLVVFAILSIGIAMFKLDPYITDVLMRDLVGHDRRPASFLVYIWLTGEQQRRASAVTISYQELAESIGISKSSAQSAVGWLIRRKLLAAAKANVTSTPAYKVLKPWRSRTPRT